VVVHNCNPSISVGRQLAMHRGFQANLGYTGDLVSKTIYKREYRDIDQSVEQMPTNGKDKSSYPSGAKNNNVEY
jgi:hypothetical protein